MARSKAFDTDRVLAKARDLFWQRGYTATSIQDLERRLGISRSSLYRTFGGKRQLYDQTLVAYQRENLSSLRGALLETDDLRRALDELFRSAALEQHPDCRTKSRGCYVVNATTEMANSCSEALHFVARNRERFVAILTEALAGAQVRGELDERSDAGELANYLFVCYNGLQVVVQTQIERDKLVRVMKRAVEGLPWS